MKHFTCSTCGDPVTRRGVRCVHCAHTIPCPPNPWSGTIVCPSCQSSDWTMPFNGRIEPGRWRCVTCHQWITVVSDHRHLQAKA